jgi:predicted Zn-dependent protease
MDKRLAKRHKRQVSREKSKVRLSEPDVRTPEQIEAAKEASRHESARGNQPKVMVSGQSFRNTLATSTGSAAKTGA